MKAKSKLNDEFNSFWNWRPDEDDKKRNNRTRFQVTEELVLEPGFGVGLGCGVGMGLALVGGVGLGGSPWNHLKLAFGLGVGCGLGVGFGFGQGLGYGSSLDTFTSNLSKKKTDLDKRFVLHI
ncbi:glycine-rich family protein [Tripterygium wilfordii]|uniref:Glycine-rich family protein n=1 Tax=Tripterygium wilfordii TaxID=458696 RepID=A0A7J7DD85_TRIWF|nr:glycine-rich family protein [Tripterygium wilfordii]